MKTVSNIAPTRIASALKTLYVTAGVILLSLPATVTTASAHAGNNDPNVVHACVNKANGITKIVGLTGSCTTGEDAMHWAIVGPRGPQGPQGQQGLQGPPGTVASFDNLAGLSCTLNGSVGTIAIIYAQNGDATLRCVVSQPPSPPAAGISGTYNVSPEIHFSCLLGLAQFTVTGFVFNASGNTLTVSPMGLTNRDMTGVINGNAFSVQVSSSFDGPFGRVNDSYTLSGVFASDNATWTGTFQAMFSGGGAEFFGCTGHVFPDLVGTRQ